MDTESSPRKRFSMIREFHFADWFTLGNAVCGTGALFSSMTYLQTQDRSRIYTACALVYSFLGLAATFAIGYRLRQALWRASAAANA